MEGTNTTASSEAAIEPVEHSNGSSVKKIGDILGVKVTIESLMEAGAHFGHQKERWNPKMLQYIYTERNGVHIINLDTTMKLWERARKYILDRASLGGSVLFVGTKIQGRDIIKEEAERSGSYFITSRWLGGTLTNFETIKNSVERMKRLEELLSKASEEGSQVKLNKKERLNISRELDKLEANLGGIRTMKKLPDVIFVVDISKDDIAIKEARRLHIPVVAMVDTNVDPDTVDFPIPSNDDAPKALRLFTSAIADAILEGKKLFESRMTRVEENTASEGTASEHKPKRGRGGSRRSEGDIPVATPQ